MGLCVFIIGVLLLKVDRLVLLLPSGAEGKLLLAIFSELRRSDFCRELDAFLCCCCCRRKLKGQFFPGLPSLFWPKLFKSLTVSCKVLLFWCVLYSQQSEGWVWQGAHATTLASTAKRCQFFISLFLFLHSARTRCLLRCLIRDRIFDGQCSSCVVPRVPRAK